MSSYRTVGELLQRCVEASGGRPFVIDGERAISYAEFDERSARVACGLYEHGVRPQKSWVALMLPGGREWLETFFAVARLGAVLVPIDPRLTAEEVDRLLCDSRASVLVTDCDHAPMLEQIYADCLTLRHVFCTGDTVDDFEAYDVLAQAPLFEPSVEVSAEDTMSLNYTSGTTAKPCGVLLSHANYDYTSEAVAAAVGLRGDDRVLSSLMACHVSTHILGPMAVVQRGATIQMADQMTDQATNQATSQATGPASGAQPLETLARTIEASRITILAAPVSFIGSLATGAEVKPGQLGRARMAVTTGASVKPEDHRSFEARFDVPLVTSYGLTEACGVSTINGPKAHRHEVGSCGKPLDGQELRVVDSKNAARRSFAVGEVVLRGPNVMQGYVDDDAATKRALHDGWLRTGDLGYVDEQGFLYLVGRKKDLIVRDGKHVYAGEVEDVLQRHPAVEEAAVIGVFDPGRGEEVVAFIVVRDGHHFNSGVAWDYCRERLAAFKCPGVIEQRDALPRSPTGHIRKGFLIQHYPIEKLR